MQFSIRLRWPEITICDDVPCVQHHGMRPPSVSQGGAAISESLDGLASSKLRATEQGIWHNYPAKIPNALIVEKKEPTRLLLHKGTALQFESNMR